MPEEAEEQDKLKRRQLEKRMRAMQIEQQKRSAIRKLLTAGAYDRLSNVRVSSPELYSQVVDLLLSMAQAGRISAIITEEQLKQILGKMTARNEPRIEFRHK